MGPRQFAKWKSFTSLFSKETYQGRAQRVALLKLTTELVRAHMHVLRRRAFAECRERDFWIVCNYLTLSWKTFQCCRYNYGFHIRFTVFF